MIILSITQQSRGYADGAKEVKPFLLVASYKFMCESLMKPDVKVMKQEQIKTLFS